MSKLVLNCFENKLTWNMFCPADDNNQFSIRKITQCRKDGGFAFRIREIPMSINFLWFRQQHVSYNFVGYIQKKTR